MSTEPTALRVETAGDPADPLVVLVHGSMDRGAGVLRLSRRLCDRYHVVRYDRRGYGRSRAAAPPYTVEQNIADLEAIVAERCDGRAAALVFGHSFGGNVALGLAARRPDLVDAVAVYETPMPWLDWWPSSSAGGAALATPDPADSAEAFMRRLVGDAVWERLPPSTRAARRAEGVTMVGELGDLRRARPWNPEQVSQPVLAACGELASERHRRATHTIADVVADGRFASITGAGHGAPNTHPDDLADLLDGFVRACAG